jgi:type I restriction enzyme, S subunit
LLEGLEIGEIKLSELERTKRIDSDFYSKKNLLELKLLIAKNSQPITNFVSVSDGNHMTISDYYCEDGIPYYRGSDIYSFFIEQASNALRIERRIFETPNMKRSHLKRGDVLMSIVGAIIGNVSLVKTNADATCSCKLAIMRPNNIAPEFFAVYLKSVYGQNQIQKFKRGAAQTGLILEDFEQLLIPNFSENIKSKTVELVNLAFSVIEKSKAIYAQAEQTLLNAVGLADFTPSTQTTNIKTFAESMGASSRIDAEYYQPKYEEIVKTLKAYGCVALERLIENYSTGYPYSSDSYLDEGLPLIRINNIKGGSLDISDCAYIPQQDIELSPKDLALENDILISMSGSIGNSCKIPNGLRAVVNQRIMRITPKNYDVDVLPIVINSIIGQSQLERIGTGGVQTNISASDIQQIFIPTLDQNTQAIIGELIRESFKLKAESEKLLNTAKRAVEIAIEQDEAAGLAYIKANNHAH